MNEQKKSVVIVDTETGEVKEDITTALSIKDNSGAYAITSAGTGAVIRDTSTSETTVLFNAVNGGSSPCSELAEQNKSITVCDIVVTSADVKIDIDDDSDDAERESKPCCHFFTTDGKHYSSVSNGISRSVKNMFACNIIPTAEHPIEIKFKTQKTKRGITHTFDIVKVLA